MKINRSFDKLRIRRMQAKPKDFELLYKWLNDSRIQNYLDGKSSHYTLEQIRDTYEPIALDMKRVKPNIIEYQNHPIGYMQYYLLLPEEYIEYQEYNHQNHDHHEHLNLKHNITEKPKNEVAYGIDLFIGDINYWN